MLIFIFKTTSTNRKGIFKIITPEKMTKCEASLTAQAQSNIFYKGIILWDDLPQHVKESRIRRWIHGVTQACS